MKFLRCSILTALLPWWTLILLALMAPGPLARADSPDVTCPPHYHWEPGMTVGSGALMSSIAAGCVPDGWTHGMDSKRHAALLQIPPEGFPYVYFALGGNHIYVQATINNKLTRWIMLDTGSDIIGLNSSAIVDAGLKDTLLPLANLSIPVDKTSDLPVSLGFVPKVQIYGTDQVCSKAPFIGPMDGLLRNVGIPVAGVLGLSGMPGKELLIDFSARRLSFFPKPAPPDKLRSLGLSEDHSLPLTPVTGGNVSFQIRGKTGAQTEQALGDIHKSAAITILVNGKPQSVELDTGSEHTILDAGSLPSDQKIPETIFTVNGKVQISPAPAADIGIAGWTLRDQSIYSFAPSTPKLSIRPRIGVDLLSQFQRILFDFADQKIYFGQPFRQTADSAAPR